MIVQESEVRALERELHEEEAWKDHPDTVHRKVPVDLFHLSTKQLSTTYIWQVEDSHASLSERLMAVELELDRAKRENSE